LDAAHIKPYALLQRHEVWNGILMRSDLHRLFDEGYITIDPHDRKTIVPLAMREPAIAAYRPHRDNLEYHARNTFQ
jgi:putative restriction endonuclease